MVLVLPVYIVGEMIPSEDLKKSEWFELEARFDLQNVGKMEEWPETCCACCFFAAETLSVRATK